MKAFIFLILFFKIGSAFGQEYFVKICNRVIEPGTGSGLYSEQIKWMKVLFETDNCNSLNKKISNIQSLSQIIPKPWSGRSKSINENIKPLELRDNFIPNDQFNEIRQKAEKNFWDLSLFSEFKNIKHISYAYDNEEGTYLCDFLEQIPSIESVTLIDSNPKEKDIECIVKNKLKVYLQGRFNPSEISEKYRVQIYGISNYLGNIEDLYRYKNLNYIGLDEFEGKSSLKVLMGVRNLTSLHINLRKVSDPHEIGNLNSLRYLSLYCTESFSPVPATAEERRCKKSGLTNINFISNLIWLKSLNLSWNEIQDLTPLEKLKNLEFLDLRMNKIQDLPSFENLLSLKYLDLAGNKISDIKNISVIKKLRLLNLANNKILKVSGLSDLKELKFLSIGNNPYNDIRNFSPSRNLKVLNLDSDSPFKFNRSNTNRASSILSSIEDNEEKFWAEGLIFENLINLYSGSEKVDRNVSILSINFEDFKNLEVLSLSNNALTEMPQLKSLKKLKYLDFSNNNLKTSFNQSLLPKQLKFLNLRNSISGELPNLTDLSSIESLDLSSNKIQLDGKEIRSNKLVFLSLAHTGQTRIPFLSGVKNLRFLEMQNNSIDSFQFNLPLESLTMLDLGYNKLDRIPDLSSHKNLKSLNLSHNLITDIQNIKTIENTPRNSPNLNLENNLILDLSLFKQEGLEHYGVYLTGNPVKRNNLNCPSDTRNNMVNSFCNSPE